jgi:hypothetical protein
MANTGTDTSNEAGTEGMIEPAVSFTLSVCTWCLRLVPVVWFHR